MDLPRDDVRKLSFEEFSTAQFLDHAAVQARQRNYADFVIVDVDSHHYESESLAEVAKYIESPVIRGMMMHQGSRAGRSAMLNSMVGYQDTGGRVTRHWLRTREKTPAGVERDIVLTKRWMDAMGVDYTCLFPRRRCARPITAGCASASSRPSRASCRCSICHSTIPRPPIAP